MAGVTQLVSRSSPLAGTAYDKHGAGWSLGSSSRPTSTSVSTPTSASSASAGYSIPSAVSGYLSDIQSLTDRNNQWSAQQAQAQMDFQRQSSERAMQFEHDEADLSRKWQEYMSNTAHQREIKDLQAAGLNPVLSAMGGQGAPVTSGAMASGYSSQGAKGDTDMSGASALVSLLGSLLQSQTALLGQSMSAQNALAVADKYTAASRFNSILSANTADRIAELNYRQGIDVAMVNRGTQVTVAGINANASVTSAGIYAAASEAAARISGQYHLTAAQQSAMASVISSSISASASRYGTDVSSWTNRVIADASRDLQRELQANGFQQDLYLQLNRQDHELEIQSRGLLGQGALTAERSILDTLGKAALYGMW